MKSALISRLKITKYWAIYLAAFIFVFLGFTYTPSSLSNTLTNTGVLRPPIVKLILLFDVSLILIGVLIFAFRKFLYRNRKEVLLSLAVFLFLFIFLEFAFRFYLYNVDESKQALYLDKDQIRLDQRYSKHHYLAYFPTPNYVGLEGDKHNSLGYRGEEITNPKPDNVFRIVALGGSTTYGSNVPSYTQTYPHLLEKKLQKEYGYSNVEVINAGIGGHNSWESLINFQFRVLDLDPDMVILYHGANDVHARLVDPQYYRGDNSGRRKAWTEPDQPFFFKSALVRYASTKITGYTLAPAIGRYVFASTTTSPLIDDLHNDILGGTPSEVLEANPPVYSERNYESIIAIAQKHDIAIFLATWASNEDLDDYASTPHYLQGFVEHNAMVRAVGQRSAVPVLDFYVSMPRDKQYWSDGRHLTAKGNEIKAALFAEFIHEEGLI